MNERLSQIFSELADFERKAGNPFPAKAFKTASDTMLKIPELTSYNDCESIPGFGKSCKEIVMDYFHTGGCSRLNKALHAAPPDDSNVIEELCKIPGIGPVKAKAIIAAGIRNRAELLALNLKEDDMITRSGVKATHQIIIGLTFYAHTDGTRMTHQEHDDIANPIIVAIEKKFPDIWAQAAGSRRRLKSTVGDIDIVMGYDGDTKEVLKHAASLLDEVVLDGEKKVSGIKNKKQVDFRIVDKNHYGALLMHSTGSAEFNIYMRKIAISQNMTLNEYGLFTRDERKNCVASKTEQDIFDALGEKFVVPEKR
jgi:DNA polymerase (family 10)